MSKNKILIVEDEPLIAEDIAEQLQLLGYEITGLVSYGEKVIDAVQSTTPDLIIMDIHLKGQMDGISAAAAVKQHCSCPVVFLTAFADEDLLQRAALTAPYGYILKPFNNRELHATIQMTLHKHALETELQDTREWLQATMNSIGDAVIVTDCDGKVKFLNPVAEALTEWPISDALGQPLSEVFTLVDIEKSGTLNLLSPGSVDYIETQNETIETARLQTHFKNIKHVSGTILSKSNIELKIEDSFAPIQQEGKETGHVLVFRDISEITLHKQQKEYLEKSLMQARKMDSLGTMAAGIAHDFNNLLSVILGFTEIAQQSSTPYTSLAQNLEEIHDTASKAKELVNQILTFARQSDSSTLALSPEPIIKQTIKFLSSFIPKNISVRTRIDTGICLIQANPTQLSQVFMNVCVNACHAMEGKPQGNLDIILEQVCLTEHDMVRQPELRLGSFARITIRDNGTGIDPSIQDRIFEPYFTTKEAGKGTGMGLSTVHGIVKSYGGFICCDSILGQGTSFSIYFPLIAPKDGLTDTSAPHVQDRISILLVDNEKSYGKMFKTLLEHLGHRVAFEESGPRALQLFSANPQSYDLVITDQVMPEMSGTELAQAIILVRPDIPIILCSGYSSALEGLPEPAACGVKAIVLKPVTTDKIKALIDQLIQQ